MHAWGFEVFGRTDALDLFARYPLTLSPTPHVLAAPGAMMVMDVTPDGRPVAVFADVADGVIARLWAVGATAEDATVEPAVSVATDDFLSQDRTACAGDTIDHPTLDAAAWPQVEAGAATWETDWRARSTAYAWECPCGHEPPRTGQTTTPVRTLVSLREPHCPFCGKAFQPEWQVDAHNNAAAAAGRRQ